MRWHICDNQRWINLFETFYEFSLMDVIICKAVSVQFKFIPSFWVIIHPWHCICYSWNIFIFVLGDRCPLLLIWPSLLLSIQRVYFSCPEINWCQLNYSLDLNMLTLKSKQFSPLNHFGNKIKQLWYHQVIPLPQTRNLSLSLSLSLEVIRKNRSFIFTRNLSRSKFTCVICTTQAAETGGS